MSYKQPVIDTQYAHHIVHCRQLVLCVKKNYELQIFQKNSRKFAVQFLHAKKICSGTEKI